MEVLLVGLGNMGLKYLRKLEELNVNIRISDVDEGKAEGLPYPFIYNLEDVPESTTHAIVAIDPKDHVEVSSTLLKKGIKVLLEKPPALNSKDFEKIKDEENLYISEIELYNPCILNLKDKLKGIKRIESKRLNKGIGYFSPLWDLAWHDLYIMDFLAGDIKIEKAEGKGFFRKVKGFAGSVPFTLEVAWKHEGDVERSMMLNGYKIDFVEGVIYEGDKNICENKKDKLKLMVTAFLNGTYLKGSKERASRIIRELEKIDEQNIY